MEIKPKSLIFVFVGDSDVSLLQKVNLK